jgi:Ser/Thr protein kinase RdoA (MazF antagonist)
MLDGGPVMAEGMPGAVGIPIDALFSPQAQITHQRSRLMMKKYIVELQGERYVIHRFRRQATFDSFIQLMEKASGAGASIQRIAAATRTAEEQRKHGYCVALTYVPGSPFDERPPAAHLASFAQNLARLHSVEGPDNQALFAAAQPKLPHNVFVKRNPDLSDAERQWIAGSLERLSSIRANNLTHGDLYAANIIADADGRVSLIDYELMAYEQAGIELAVALLRSFCRHEGHRRLVLETYLSNCSPAVAQAWQTHSVDFLFAAAARLAVMRRRRFLRLSFANYLLKLRRLLPGSTKAVITQRIDKNEKLGLSASVQAEHYAKVARALVQFSLVSPVADTFAVFDAVQFDRQAARPVRRRRATRH